MDASRSAMHLTALARRYREIRSHTLQLVDGLSAEDCMVQSMPDASPVKWHLAHTTWFFETFVLSGMSNAQPPFDLSFRVLFNSYYVGVGERHPRPERGALSRPGMDAVLAWRRRVDELVLAALASGELSDEQLALVELGMHHEQQHQELILTDIKYHFSRNPVWPAWHAWDEVRPDGNPMGFLPLDGGLVEIGHPGNAFCFDNERPRHRVWIEPYELAMRNVRNAEYLAFIEDGGYSRPELWLSDGWDCKTREGWQAPLYWRWTEAGWRHYTLGGDRALDLAASVMHVSYYEADAYARWAGCRLPTEAEWEQAQTMQPHLPGLFGEVWQWVCSAYLPYPGFAVADGAVGEYNGKFMINQMVLRGSSVATPSGHARGTYRNFFPPAARWQFSGIRLAR